MLAQHHKSDKIMESLNWRSDGDPVEKETDDFTEDELLALETILQNNQESPGALDALRRIGSYLDIKKNPTGAKVGKLENLAQALVSYIGQESKDHWLLRDKGDLFLPWWVSSVKYHPRERRENPAHVTLTLKAISRGNEVNDMLSWHAEDLRGGGHTVISLLQAKGYFVPTKASLAVYAKQVEQYKKFQPQTGEQFIASGNGIELSDRYSHRATALVREGVPNKLVMDDKSEEGRAFGTDDGMESNSFWLSKQDDNEDTGRIPLPLHPYVKLFDLDNHNFVIAHTDQLEPYKWTPEIGDKLILPEAHKQVISILMETAADDIDDIIRGKSGGTIVISTGDPGTGKTLTAEVTSEVIKRPLYKVNCSQLGTNEEAIETKLNLVMNRAARWKALLLIDEADVYIRARGIDIQQNAIVGVFLRVLEYYRGVLFLTSNMATAIDDAIMSRATVHLKYTKPTEEALHHIWETLSKQFKLDFKRSFIEKLVDTFPGIVGRDVKQLLKLVIRYNKKIGGEITLETFKLLAVHKDIKIKGEK